MAQKTTFLEANTFKVLKLELKGMMSMLNLKMMFKTHLPLTLTQTLTVTNVFVLLF